MSIEVLCDAPVPTEAAAAEPIAETEVCGKAVPQPTADYVPSGATKQEPIILVGCDTPVEPLEA